MVTKSSKIAIFKGSGIRREWNASEEKWYFSVVDIVGVLSGSVKPRNYWKVLKSRLKNEGSEVVTKCNQLKMIAPDGKKQFFVLFSLSHLQMQNHLNFG